MSRKLFCDINPVCFKISEYKEYLKRDIKDFIKHDKIATKHSDIFFDNIIKSHFSLLKRKLVGVSMELQENKVTNIRLACDKINGLIIYPKETFSFWKTVGKASQKNGYKKGLVITRKGNISGYGGGLCQMANLIHFMVLNSPLIVTEIHHHSDALFPDDRRRVPFGSGTSISYKNYDYRFYNNLSFPVQIKCFVDGDYVYGELLSLKDVPYRYKLIEENDHFHKEKNGYYRISKVFKITIDKKTNKEINKELILDNHSKVLYDYKLIPKDKIK